MGVASATHPDWYEPDNAARIRFEADGTYVVQIAAAEIGTGSWTALTQIAAEALGCPVQCVRMEMVTRASRMPPTPEVRSGLAAGVQPSLRPPRRSAISTAPTRSRGGDRGSGA